MLKCNGQLINTVAPKTQLDQEVLKRLNEIVKKYNLDKGGSCVFEYADGLRKPDRDNPGKSIAPAGIKIPFKALEVLSSGSREWIYFTGSYRAKDGITEQYRPKFDIFGGKWELGLDKVELIFFLLDIYPYIDGGANQNKSKEPVLKVRDEVAAASKIVEAKREAIKIESKIYLGEENGGYSEKEIRSLASKLGIADASGDLVDINIVINAIDTQLKLSPGKVVDAVKSMSKPDADLGINEIIQQAEDMKLLRRGKTSDKKKEGWFKFELQPDGTIGGEPVMFFTIPANSKDARKSFIDAMKKDLVKFEKLKTEIEAINAVTDGSSGSPEAEE